MRWNIEVEKLKIDCPECRKGKLTAVWLNGKVGAYHCAACKEQFGATHRFQERKGGGLEFVEMAQPLRDESTTYDIRTIPVPEA